MVQHHAGGIKKGKLPGNLSSTRRTLFPFPIAIRYIMLNKFRSDQILQRRCNGHLININIIFCLN